MIYLQSFELISGESIEFLNNIIANASEMSCDGTFMGWHKEEKWRRRIKGTTHGQQDIERFKLWINTTSWIVINPPPHGLNTSILCKIDIKNKLVTNEIIAYGNYFKFNNKWYQPKLVVSKNIDFGSAFYEIINADDTSWIFDLKLEHKPKNSIPRLRKAADP